MRRELDEIEMELGKERTLKVICPGARWCHKRCVSMGDTNHSVPHEHRQSCDMEDDCPGKCIPVEPDCSWLDRLSLITYPEDRHCTASHCHHLPGAPECAGCRFWCLKDKPLFICDKARECHDRKRGSLCNPHVRYAGVCDLVYYCPSLKCDTRCIPYVPEDEARDWFVACKDGDGVTTSQSWDSAKAVSSHLVSKSDALARAANYTVVLRAPHRAFKWQDGIR